MLKSTVSKIPIMLLYENFSTSFMFISMPNLKGVYKIQILSLDVWKIFNVKWKMSQCKVSQFPNFQFSLDLKTIQCKVGKLVSSWHSPPPRLASTKSKRNPELYPLNFSVYLLKILALVHMGMKPDRFYITRRELTMLFKPSYISLFATSCSFFPIGCCFFYVELCGPRLHATL